MAQVDYAAIDAPPPTSVNPDQNDDDYHRLSEGSNEIKQGSCMKWMKSERFIQNSICIGLITALLYVLLCVVSFMMMSESKGIESASIYTQALDDWTAKAWTDFIWSNTGDCPDGYEPLTRTWGGTFRFNATNGYVIEYVDSLDMKSKYPADF